MSQQLSNRQSDNSYTTDSSTVVKIDDVSKHYGSTTAAENISISVSEGEFLTLLGPSGAGKTTLLHMISGFETPSEGEIYINDRPMSDKPPYERNIGIVFQDLALFPHMTVAENIAYPLEMRRMPSNKIREKVDEVIELVRLPEGYRSKPVEDLSGGQQQRVAVARAIVYEPNLLLLDEPLSSLDKKLRGEMREELMRIHRETNLTIIHVTHDQTQALSMADRIAVLNEGEIVQIDNTQNLYHEPSTPFVAEFIGTTTLFSGTVVDQTQAYATAKCGDAQVTFNPTDEISARSSVTLGIRAENVFISDDSGSPKENVENNYMATIQSVSFEGDRTQYEVKVKEADMTLQIIEQNSVDVTTYRPKADVRIGWRADDTLVFSE